MCAAAAAARALALRAGHHRGDFPFIFLNKTLPCQHLLRGWLRWLGVSEQESFGLNNRAYTVENVPLGRPARPGLAHSPASSGPKEPQPRIGRKQADSPAWSCASLPSVPNTSWW